MSVKRLVALLGMLVLMVPVGALAQPPKGPHEWTAHPPIHIGRHSPTSPPPSGYTPSQILHAYGFDSLTVNGGGQLIAIVDAYDDPTIQSDLQTFIQAYMPTQTIHGVTDSCTLQSGPHPCFQKAYPQGLPQPNGGWALEISLDVEWAHAIAPGADILLVEAASSSLSNLLGAVNYAVSSGARTISMSWGGSEFSMESSYDSYFAALGVMFTAASGDSGSGTEWPAVSPYVVSVGGTTLSLDSVGDVLSETAWSGSGGGISAYETEPGYQSSYPIPATGGKRGNPDVSYDADPNTGVLVYDSTPYNGSTGWFVVGGTSVGTPQWAALFALVAQARQAAGLSSQLSTTSATSPVYSAASPPLSATYSANFRDITSGSDGGRRCSICAAGPGYDFVTGLGSPLANGLVPNLSR